MPTVKNSKTMSASPTISSRNTTDGLVRECWTDSKVPGLRKLTGWSAVWRGPSLVSTCLAVVRRTGPAAVGTSLPFRPTMISPSVGATASISCEAAAVLPLTRRSFSPWRRVATG